MPVRRLQRKIEQVKGECDLSTTKVTIAKVTVEKVTVAKVTVEKATDLLWGQHEFCNESDGDLTERNLKQCEVCSVRVRRNVIRAQRKRSGHERRSLVLM